MLFMQSEHLPRSTDRTKVSTARGSVPQSNIIASSGQVCEETRGLLRAATAEFWHNHHLYLDISIPNLHVGESSKRLLVNGAALGTPPLKHIELKLRMGALKVDMIFTIPQPREVRLQIPTEEDPATWPEPSQYLPDFLFCAASQDVPLHLEADPSSLDLYNILKMVCIIYELET